jgi:hypothetical protein
MHEESLVFRVLLQVLMLNRGTESRRITPFLNVGALQNRSEASMSYMRESMPDSGLGFQVKVR